MSMNKSAGKIALVATLAHMMMDNRRMVHAQAAYTPPKPEIPEGSTILLRHDEDLNTLAREYDLAGCKVIQATDEEDYARILAEFKPKRPEPVEMRLAELEAPYRKQRKWHKPADPNHVNGKLPTPPKSNGLKRFEIDGVEVWAINEKNARRKAAKMRD